MLDGVDASKQQGFSSTFEGQADQLPWTNLSFIQCYAPFNDSDDMDKEVFYEQLQETLESTHRRDLLLVTGNLNADVGSENVNYETVMGREGCGIQNGNGERLKKWCAFNMIIGGTIFPYRNIHKLTWTFLNGRDQPN